MKIKIKRLLPVLLSVFLISCAAPAASRAFIRDMSAIDYSAVKFTPWDAGAAAGGVTPQDERDYTVMIYMNGSDLESEHGAATADINEILRSGVDAERVNIIVFTGGANRWRNSVVPDNECALWRVNGGTLEKIAGAGLLNMGDAGTLSGFIRFALDNYPARRRGLIMWDHGGGSVAGYGHDENFNNGTLSLLEMEYAFEQAGLALERLDFIGFDACLMAAVEVAVVAERYADFLIASEDLEPGDGWDYTCFSALNDSPGGAEFGITAAKAFRAFYGDYTAESVTLSVTDLSGARDVMGAMDALMERCSAELGSETAFYALAKRRKMTKTFGGGSPRGEGGDMVDAGDMARRLASMFPAESAAVVSALNGAVVFNTHNSDVKLGGLSAYYIFSDWEGADYALATYESLNMSPAYTGYLRGFASRLSSYGGARPDSLYAYVNGKTLRAYPAYRSNTGAAYAVPAVINGEESDVIIFRKHGESAWRVLGSRREDGFIIQKGLDGIKPEDDIRFFE